MENITVQSRMETFWYRLTHVQLVQELRQRKEGGETDLIIVKGKIVTRRTWQDAEY